MLLFWSILKSEGTMKLTNKKKALLIREDKIEDKKPTKSTFVPPERHIGNDLEEQFNQFHLMNVRPDYSIEKELLQDEMGQIIDNNLDGAWDNSLLTFSPSGVDKCNRELFFKLSEHFEEDEFTMTSQQKRWVRNGSAVHKAIQSDFAYMLKYHPDAPFQIHKTKDNKFSWERNTRKVVKINHNGVEFQLYGMMDGLLKHVPSGELIGFDAKTKSTSIAAVGDYLLRKPQDSNVQQMVGYSIIFGINKFIIYYESLAKDGWNKGDEARKDTKSFVIEVTEEMRQSLLDKLSEVIKDVQNKNLPDKNLDKCLFCNFKNECVKHG